jgi:hypothetical protein
VLAEHPFDRHRVRLMLGQPPADPGFKGKQPGRDVVPGRGAQDVGCDQDRRPPGHPVDHPEPAPGQPGIDAEHPHASPSWPC